MKASTQTVTELRSDPVPESGTARAGVTGSLEVITMESLNGPVVKGLN